MAQGESVAFFANFQSKFQILCEEFDSRWLQRRRTLNTKIIVLLLWKLVSGKNGSSITINDFWCKSYEFLEDLGQPLAIAGSSFCEARRKLCFSFFKKLNSLLSEMADEAISERWLGHRIFCVDGTKVNLPRKLRASGFSLPSPSSYYPQGLVSCLFNLLNKTPHDFLFTRNQNELLAAKKLVLNLKKDDVIVYDRVFLSYAMLAFHLKRGLHAVFRAKEKHTFKSIATFLGRNKTDELVTIYCKGLGEITVRLISYKIKKTRYCLLTTLTDKEKYPLSKLKEIYHARWGVEEFFKLSKAHLNLENFHSRNKKGVEQEIYAHFVLLHLSQIMAKLVSPEKQINRHHAVNQIVQNLEHLFLSGKKKLTEHWLPWIFGIMGRCRVPIRKGRSYARRSRKPINRWQKNINREWERKQLELKGSKRYA
jgi:hypothetical protein